MLTRQREIFQDHLYKVQVGQNLSFFLGNKFSRNQYFLTGHSEN